MKPPKVKPCPFCGQSAVLYEVTVTEEAVICSKCRANIVRPMKQQLAAVTAWNRTEK